MDIGTRMVLCACLGAVIVLLWRIQGALRRIATWLEEGDHGKPVYSARAREIPPGQGV